MAALHCFQIMLQRPDANHIRDEIGRREEELRLDQAALDELEAQDDAEGDQELGELQDSISTAEAGLVDYRDRLVRAELDGQAKIQETRRSTCVLAEHDDKATARDLAIERALAAAGEDADLVVVSASLLTLVDYEVRQ